MAAPMAVYVFSLILCISPISSDSMLDGIVESIEEYVQYNLKYPEEVDLFTLYSLNIVEGTLAHLLSERDEMYILSRLSTLREDIAAVKAMTIDRMDKEEITTRWRLLNEPWLPPKAYRIVDEKYRWKETSMKSEDLSKLSMDLGKCNMQITSKRRQMPSKQSRVDKKCMTRKYMMKEQTTSPNILHLQALFFLTAEMYGFKEFVNAELMKAKVFGGTQEALLEICTNAFFHCQKLLDNGKIIFRENDNFITLAFQCSAAGFMQFLHIDWLHHVLGQQLEEGCFTSQVEERYIRCDSHYSANVVTLLAQYMLLVAEPGSATHQEHVNITGINYLKDGLPVPVEVVEDINGPLPVIGKPKMPELPASASQTRRISPGQLGVVLCLVLVAGTVGVLVWMKRLAGKNAQKSE